MWGHQLAAAASQFLASLAHPTRAAVATAAGQQMPDKGSRPGRTTQLQALLAAAPPLAGGGRQWRRGGGPAGQPGPAPGPLAAAAAAEANPEGSGDAPGTSGGQGGCWTDGDGRGCMRPRGCTWVLPDALPPPCAACAGRSAEENDENALSLEGVQQRMAAKAAEYGVPLPAPAGEPPPLLGGGVPPNAAAEAAAADSTAEAAAAAAAAVPPAQHALPAGARALQGPEVSSRGAGGGGRAAGVRPRPRAAAPPPCAPCTSQPRTCPAFGALSGACVTPWRRWRAENY